MLLYALFIRPDLLDYDECDPKEPLDNIEKAFSVAEKELDVIRLIDPEGQGERDRDGDKERETEMETKKETDKETESENEREGEGGRDLGRGKGRGGGRERGRRNIA